VTTQSASSLQALASAEAPWEVSGLPLQLVDSLRHKLDGTPVELPPINLPQDVPGVPAGVDQMGPVERAEVALRLQDRYARDLTNRPQMKHCLQHLKAQFDCLAGIARSAYRMCQPADCQSVVSCPV
jgi:hypothetical protein